MRYKLYMIVVFMLSFALNANAQSDSTRLKTLATGLEKLLARKPVEKIYLQLNKPGYDLGDTVWFKAYVTVGVHHQPSALSATLYVELIDTKDKLIKSLQLKNDNGIAKGEFGLDEKLEPGQYHIRAYTNWMRNASADYFYNRAININNSKSNAVFITPQLTAAGDQVSAKLDYTDKLGRAYDKREVTYEVRADTNLLFKGNAITDASGNIAFSFPGKTAPGQRVSVTSHFKLVNGITIDKTTLLALPNNNNIDVQFFPEGGQLITDVRAKVAFKAIGQNGLGLEVKGTVVDNENNEVAELQSQHAGMGVFAFMPQAGKTYMAKINGQSIALPKVESKGFVLSVNNNPDDSAKLNIRIATNQATLNENNGRAFYIIGQSNGAVYYTSAGKLDNATFNIQVRKDRFPSGIAQFTLFDAGNQPLNERIVFIKNPGEMLNISLSSDKRVYNSKEKVTLNFAIKENGDKLIPGSFAVSVYNEDKQGANENAESTILSDLLLTSDLKGYIEEPNYYFNPANDQNRARADLDVLMLTQGYRRYEWKDALTNTLGPVVYQPEKGLTISGQLTATNGKPVAKGSLKILALAEQKALTTETGDDGRFKLGNVDFTDSTKLVIQARKANDGKNVNITLDNNHTAPLIFKSNLASLSENNTPLLPRTHTADSNTVPLARQNADTAQIAALIKENTAIFNEPGKALKEVIIKEHGIEKPDQSNLWGTVKPTAVVTGDQLQDYSGVASGLSFKIPSLYYINGQLWDTKVYFSQEKRPHSPIPIIIDGVKANAGFKLDDLLNADVIEDIKLMQSNAYKAIYGIGFENLNDKVLLVTTKTGAGTVGIHEKPDTLKNIKLKEVTVKSRKNGDAELAPWIPTMPHTANLNGPGHADIVLSAKDLSSCFDLVDCVINRIMGVTGTGDNMRFVSGGQKGLNPPPIKFMLDGIFVSYENLSSVNVADIESVEVLKSLSYLNVYGTNASGGLIIFTSKLGLGLDGGNDAIAYKSVPGVIYTKFNGYYQAKKFYEPKYTPQNSTTPDKRTAVYWNPDIIINEKGTLPLEFYNSDVKGTYRAVVEGIDNDGNLGRYVYRYRVE